MYAQGEDSPPTLLFPAALASSRAMPVTVESTVLAVQTPSLNPVNPLPSTVLTVGGVEGPPKVTNRTVKAPWSTTHTTPRATSTATPQGLAREAAVPTPDTLAFTPFPARVDTMVKHPEGRVAGGV